MTVIEPLVEYLLDIATAGELALGDVLAVTLTGQATEIHHLPAGLLEHPYRLLDLIAKPDQLLIVLLSDPGTLPGELHKWEKTRTVIAAEGVWLHDPIVTNLRRWWRLEAGQSALTGTGTPSHPRGRA